MGYRCTHPIRSQTSTLWEGLQKDSSISRNIQHHLPTLVSLLVLGLLLGEGFYIGIYQYRRNRSFNISHYPTAPVPELQECPLTMSSLYPSAMHTHTGKILFCIWDMDYKGILLIKLEGPVLPGLPLQSANSSLLLLLCLPVEKISKPYLQIFLPLGPLPNAALLRLLLFH